ncbi:hypothetical protein NDU88_001661 [Pleurodeles waltl]|uniref:Uncharacterized protein n=1 Tax=Pleurodeles waltl TaxID=8319 RepID=A0AAV7UUY8_PLEWA|nr:hypothetical protein NDU88_001661 [Pleurodeles waltl]
MSVRLFDYNYVVQYLPGVKNTVADFLSRMPLPSNGIEEFQNTEEDGKEDMWVAIVEEARNLQFLFMYGPKQCQRHPTIAKARLAAALQQIPS